MTVVVCVDFGVSFGVLLAGGGGGVRRAVQERQQGMECGLGGEKRQEPQTGSPTCVLTHVQHNVCLPPTPPSTTVTPPHHRAITHHTSHLQLPLVPLIKHGGNLII
jgi:hypothetical protein